MSSKVVNLRERLKNRWLEREEQQETSRLREYESCGKNSIRCKCPRCEIEHQTFIRWSGRGMPRVYCSTCRALISSLSHASIGQLDSMTTKGARKGTYQGYE